MPRNTIFLPVSSNVEFNRGSSDAPLGTPTGFTATPRNSKVELQWNAIIGVLRYHIYFNTTGGVTVSDTKIKVFSPEITFEHTGLINGTTYFYKIASGGPGGESALSSEISVTPTLFLSTSSLIFDGVDERVNISDIPGLETDTTMSIGLWVKSNGLTGTFRNLFAGGDDSSLNPRIQILISDSNLYAFFIRDNAGLDSGVIEGNAEDDSWHFLVLVRNGSSWKLFDNASISANTTYTPGTINLGRFDLAALTSNAINSGFLLGLMDEVAVWNINLSSDDITRLYNSGNPTDLLSDATSTSLLHWWRMGDGDTFPTILDSKGSNNGTMINMEVGDIINDVP